LARPTARSKRGIFGENVARLYRFQCQADLGGRADRLAAMKGEYERSGTGRSDLRYGYVTRG
jgi:hypothetical protein